VPLRLPRASLTTWPTTSRSDMTANIVTKAYGVPHAAESTHWYNQFGEPAYTVKAKDGKDRPTTLRDARKLGLYPSVTTIIKCAAAPGLELWKARQLMMAALTLPREKDESEDAWLARVSVDSKAQAKKAAERGTEIHAAIQRHYEAEGSDPALIPFVEAATNAVNGWAGHFKHEWVAERSFSTSFGYGGKVDLSSFSDDTGFVLDFKTKEFDKDDELKTWDEHAMQLAAYRDGLALPEARCAIVYVSVNHPGVARLIEIPEEDLAQGWKMFEALLAYWKAKNNYEPKWMEKAA
jgi:hypothetical protein